MKKKSNTTWDNIENFSKFIGSSYRVNADIIKNYLLANISSALTINNDVITDISSLYLQDKFKYNNAANNSTCINSIIFKQGTVEQELCCRRALGILLIAETDLNLRYKVIKILRKFYPIVYNSVKKNNRKELAEKYIRMDELSREAEARLDAAVYFYFSIYRSSEKVHQAFINSIVTEIENFESYSPLTANIDEELKLHKAEIHEIKLLLEKNYGKIENYKDILFNKNKEVRASGTMGENLFYIDKFDINSIFSNSIAINIDKIILAYIKSGNKNSDSMEILQNISNGIFIKSLLKEYKVTRNLYLQNNEEALYLKIDSLEETLNSAEKEINDLKAASDSHQSEKMMFNETLNNKINKVNKSHKSEITHLEGKIKELEKQLNEEKKSKRELNALREVIFQVNNDYVPTISDKTLKTCITDKKLVIIGGSKDWRRRFREKYPEIQTLHGFNENIDISFLSGADFIFFYTGYMNHATYYKAMNFIRTNQIKFGYIGKTNMELVEQEIIEELQKPQRK